MKLFEKKKDGNRRNLYFCGKRFLSYKKKNNQPIEVKTYFTTLNYFNEYTNGQITRSDEKCHMRILKYLEKYMYALDYDLEIEPTNEYNNPIWQLWLQGEENMPPIVKICTESVKKYNPERNIILLTKDNLKDYVDLPEYIWDKYEKGVITHTHFSDIVRFYLLYKYGGTWADATIFMSDKMPEYIKNSDFFVFKDLTSSLIKLKMTLEQFVIVNNMRDFGSWTNSISFIHSKKGNKLIGNNLKLMLEYWKNEDSICHYLFCSYFFTLVIFSDKKLKEDFIKAPYIISTNEYGALQGCLYEHYDEKMVKQIMNLTPIHKLTYKNQDKNVYEDSLLNHILKYGLDDVAKNLVHVERE